MHASWHNAPDFLRKNRSSGSGVSRHGADSRQTTEEPAETVGGSEESTEAAGTDQAAAEAVETTDFQWALYNQNGELCVEATTDISQAESGVTLLLIGDGNLDDLFSHIG